MGDIDGSVKRAFGVGCAVSCSEFGSICMSLNADVAVVTVSVVAGATVSSGGDVGGDTECTDAIYLVSSCAWSISVCICSSVSMSGMDSSPPMW